MNTPAENAALHSAADEHWEKVARLEKPLRSPGSMERELYLYYAKQLNELRGY